MFTSPRVWPLDLFTQAWTMLTGNGAVCITAAERLFVSFVIMLGGFVQAREDCQPGVLHGALFGLPLMSKKNRHAVLPDFCRRP